jgi:glycerophosphoryl diester phosphodiesterase
MILDRAEIRLLFRKLVFNWRQFLVIHLSINALLFVLLTPAAVLLLRLAITLSGNAALSDEDILFFIISPWGLGASVVFFAVFAILVFLETAALITAAQYSSLGKTASIPLVLVAQRAPRLFRLAVLILGQVILRGIPFALLVLAVYWFLLTDYDINYYLAVKPTEWYAALGLAAVICMGWAYQLLRLFISWVFCLPLLLLSDITPYAALTGSMKAVAGQRMYVARWLGGWLLASTLAGAAASGIVGIIGAFLIQASVESLKALLLVLSLVSLIGYIASFVITFISSSLLALIILKLFSDVGLDDRLRQLPAGRRKGSFTFNVSWRFLALALLAGLLISLWVVNTLMKQIEFEDRTEIMAHRGASAVAPENTMAAVKAAIDSGAQWVEIDVQETADGEVVVIHDRDLKKIGGVSLTVAGSSLEELQQVDIGSWFGEEFSGERLPTLDEVLRMCKNRIKVNIELKYYGAQQQLEQRVAQTVDAQDMANEVVIMSLDLQGIMRMRNLRPDWTLGLLSSVSVGNLAALDVDFLALNARFTSRRLVRQIHQQGKKVMVWTVNDPVGMSSMATRGVDVIITDEPALGVALMEHRKDLQPPERMLMQLGDIFQKPSLFKEQ